MVAGVRCWRCSTHTWFALLLLLVGAQSTFSWQQDEFAISIWVDPVVHPAEFEAQYEVMARCNITVLLGGFGATNEANVLAQLDACAKTNLKAIVSTCGGISAARPGACVQNKSISTHSALWGYQVKDEPAASEFENLRTWSGAIESQAGSETLSFINLLPNYATPAQLNASTYGEYVQRYMDTVKPGVLCMDHYPLFENDDMSANISTDGYHRNLKVFRAHSVATGVNFWNFFNAMPFASHLAPSEGQIAWQAFTSLAYGSKGVLYFTYWSPGFPAPAGVWHRSLGKSQFTKGGGLISPVGFGPGGQDGGDNSSFTFRPTLQYEYARRVNSVLLNFGNFLLRSESVTVWRPHLEHAPPTSPVVALNETNSAGQPGMGTPAMGEYCVGVFSLDKPGELAVLLVNQRHDIELWPTVTFTDKIVVSQVREVDPSSGATRAVQDDSPSLPGLQMALAPGYARLIVVSV